MFLHNRTSLSVSRIFLIGFLLFQLAESTYSQYYTRRNSPFSRYGYGDLFTNYYSSVHGSAGAFASTYSSIWDYSISNPASLTHIRSTNYDLSVFYKHSILNETATQLTAPANDGNIDYLAIAFPITKSWEIATDTLRRGIPIQWGMGVNLVPFSTVGYDSRVKRELEDIGSMEYKYAGSGTRYRINWSNGVAYKGLSVGANLGFIFGNIEDRKVITFTDSAFVFGYSERFLTNESAYGFVYDLGLQYDLYFIKKTDKPDPLKHTKLTFGATYSGSAPIQLSQSEERIRYGSYYSIDTLLLGNEVKGEMTLPQNISFGIAITKGLSWRVGANFEYQICSQSSNSFKSLSVADNYKIALGAEFTPDFLDFSNYLKRIRYRLGGFYGTDARIIELNSKYYQLYKYGITFGLGLHMKPKKVSATQILGQIQLAFEYGYMGHPDVISEQYFQVHLGFTLNDHSWFRRARFR